MRNVLIIVTMLTIAMTGLAFGQTGQPPAPAENVDDAELQQFAQALNSIQTAQQEVQIEMQEIVAASPMGEERFNEIHETVNTTGEMPGNANEAETQDYQQIVQELSTVQQDLQVEMATIVQDTGMEVERFNSIVMAIQQDEDLWQRIQQIMN